MTGDNPEQNAPKEILKVGENVREDAQLNQLSDASFKGGVADKMQAPGSIKDAGFKSDSDLLGDSAISKMKPAEIQQALASNEKAITSQQQHIDNIQNRIANVTAAQGQAETMDRNSTLARARESV